MAVTRTTRAAPLEDPDGPSSTRRRRERLRRRRRAARRRLTLLVGVLVLAVAGLGVVLAAEGGEGAPPPAPMRTPGVLELRSGDTTLGRVDLASVMGTAGRVDEAALRAAVYRVVPPVDVASRGRARIRYRLARSAAVERGVALGAGGGMVRVVRRPVASLITAPVVRQAQRNICEAAALEVLLATAGVQADQLRLQARMPRSGSPDPRDTASGRQWGDPELGYVGRPDGGGVAGGFGVYQRPVQAVARQYGRRLDDVTRSSPRRIYSRLLRGRAVMAWVGLSAGPYGEWTSPSGRPVRVNFGEHTVVLTGVRPDGQLRVVNPLEGTRETWSKASFESMWALLGRRGLAA